VSQIIECPACSTRYKLNKAISKGGRPVKCARCGHQWQLEPDVKASNEAEHQETVYEPNSRTEARDPVEKKNSDFVAQSEARREQSDWDSHSNAFDGPEFQKPAGDPPPANWHARRDHLVTAISTLSEPNSAEYEAWDNKQTEVAPENTVESDWTNPDEFNAETQFSNDEHETDKAYSAGLSFLNTQQGQPQADEREPGQAASNLESGSGWASRLMRPWRSKSEGGEAERLDDGNSNTGDTETAIRQALKHALENPAEFDETNKDYKDYVAEASAEAAKEQPDYDPGFRSSRNWRETKVEDPLDQDKDASSDLDTDRSSLFPFPDFKTDSETFENTDEDDQREQYPPFRLTGKNANAPIFGSGDDYEGQAHDEESRLAEDSSFTQRHENMFEAETGDGERVEEERSDHPGYDDGLDDFTKLYDRQFEPNKSHDSDEDEPFYEEIATLQPEPESTDIAAYKRKRRHGGLALAAGWAAFISVISGVIIALISFRQDITVALPGTTHLYQTLGFDVARTGVDFADVRYRWTTAEGKPMIEVTGQVVNITDGSVKVPRVLVNVRDAGGTDSVTATATVPKEELAPRETTSFTLEFLSPPENVTQIELAFDDKR
jgi:predicted Zn finger-like uncharacterized protein